ncbi:hypothetical protein ES319_D06G093400v1 [Gossypium barbadense]|uniref:Thioesterase domain-containing protein n=2 Tax=Gossypium TaxID=3633 RepID=A0A5J5R2L4_GOSBA|nr:hypothetical protein ES319_D06G093400v1 [Gossypium barbadense]TYG64343.1 hypothetical protein ES288_D06G100200v1 [Gossypium darwinii]
MLPTILVKSSMRMLLTLPLGFLSMFSDECQPVISHELVALTLESPLIVVAQKDPDGNWEVGAMSTLIDDVGAAAIYSVADHVKASLDFNISFHSTAWTQEEVEIEAKVIAEKGKLSLVVVEIRRKRNGDYH